MKKGICIIDYIGHSDKNGQPVGHPIKTINEYTELLRYDIDINLAIPKNYKDKVDLENIKKLMWLNYYTDVTTTNFKTKVLKIFRKLSNINKTLKNDDSKVIWFINMDFALGLAFILFPGIKRRKIWITNYLHEYSDGSKLSNFIKNYFFHKIINKVDRIISSNEGQLINNGKMVYIPDYFYDPKVYDKYLGDDKKNQFVCLGTMSESKDLESLIRTFNKVPLPLKIFGKFYDETRYKNLIKLANENIEIRNVNLEYDDFYKLISNSKYVILPYKKDFYNQRTSGVLLETIFLNSIPIAPEFLLKVNNIKGIAFEELNEICEVSKKKNMLENIITENTKTINTIYNIDFIREKLKECFIYDLKNNL